MEEIEKTYKTVKVYKRSNKRRVITTGLTEQQTQREVKHDIEINPECNVYMLVYCLEC